jgi:hypothetical protein
MAPTWMEVLENQIDIDSRQTQGISLVEELAADNIGMEIADPNGVLNLGTG